MNLNDLVKELLSYTDDKQRVYEIRGVLQDISLLTHPFIQEECKYRILLSPDKKEVEGYYHTEDFKSLLYRLKTGWTILHEFYLKDIDPEFYQKQKAEFEAEPAESLLK